LQPDGYLRKESYKRNLHEFANTQLLLMDYQIQG
jgi:hypothetical protein